MKKKRAQMYQQKQNNQRFGERPQEGEPAECFG